MEFLKFDRSFVNSLNLQQSGQVVLDNCMQGYLKNFLVGNYSFVQESEKNVVKAEIEESYKDLLQVCLVEFDEIKRLVANKTKSHTRDLTQNYGDEKTEGSYFEPVVNNTQNEVKTTGQKVTKASDSQIETIQEEESNNDNLALKEFYDNLKYKVEDFFKKYINQYFWEVEL